ncbi:MAG: hypothetical protein WD972_01995, partial [Candidatus Andersenbacteria bacterium]
MSQPFIFLKLKHVALRFPPAAWLLVVAWVFFFSRLIVGKSVYFLGDLKTIYYPLEYAYALAQRVGQLPHWS